MLRGMGWKDGDGIGLNKGKKQEKSKIPERRPALLGIGAKEEAAVAQEMGAWGKAARGKGGKEPVIYNPILLKDKKTGEMFTEEEAQKRREKDEREQYEMEFEKKERERERGKDRDRDSRRRRDYEDDDRERRREKDRRHDRETTGIGIVIVTGRGGGMMTARTKRNAVAVRRKRDGDANVMTTIMTASAQGVTRRTVTDDETGVANTGGDNAFCARLYRAECLVLAGWNTMGFNTKKLNQTSKLLRADRTQTHASCWCDIRALGCSLRSPSCSLFYVKIRRYPLITLPIVLNSIER